MKNLLLVLVIFLASPISLEMGRWPCALVVAVLLAIAFVLQPRRQIQAPGLERAAIAMLLMLICNFGIATFVAGNSKVEAMSELVQPFELFAAFWLVSTVRFDDAEANKWLKWACFAVLIRAGWQLGNLWIGREIVPQIYDTASDNNAVMSLGGFWLTRPIDPVVGMFVPVGIVLSANGIQKRLALATASVCGVVSLLSWTRSEWLASLFFCVSALALGRSRALRIAALSVCLASAGIYIIGLAVPEFAQQIEDRAFGHTAEQLQARANSIGRLRILELEVAEARFAEAPIFGHGVGAHFGTTVAKGNEPVWIHFHNYYLNLLTNAGLLGVALLSIVGYFSVRFALRTHKAAETPLRAAVSACALGSLVWWATVLAFEPIYVAYHIPVFIGMFYGMCLSLRAAPSQAPILQDITLAAHDAAPVGFAGLSPSR